MGVRLAVAAFAAVVLASGARAAPPHLHLLSSGRIAADLAAGRSVVDDHASIAGDVDLRHARQPGQYTERVRGLFVCTSCRFVGSIVARHVVFDRGIDLTGSTIAGSLDLHGSSFREPALFGGVRQTGGSVDFGFTSFDDLAVFRGATFEAESSFASAQFRSVARFGNATFGRRASFDDAIFSDDALFSGATFTGLAGFSGALLGSVTDFRNAKFLAGATFEEASLLGRAEFSRALMVGTTKFLETRFGSDVLFIGTNFSPTTGAIDPSVQFENATAQGRIDLADARLSGSATFNNVDAGRLSFLGMEFNDPSSKLGLTDLREGGRAGLFGGQQGRRRQEAQHPGHRGGDGEVERRPAARERSPLPDPDDGEQRGLVAVADPRPCVLPRGRRLLRRPVPSALLAARARAGRGGASHVALEEGAAETASEPERRRAAPPREGRLRACARSDAPAAGAPRERTAAVAQARARRLRGVGRLLLARAGEHEPDIARYGRCGPLGT